MKSSLCCSSAYTDLISGLHFYSQLVNCFYNSNFKFSSLICLWFTKIRGTKLSQNRCDWKINVFINKIIILHVVVGRGCNIWWGQGLYDIHLNVCFLFTRAEISKCQNWIIYQDNTFQRGQWWGMKTNGKKMSLINEWVVINRRERMIDHCGQHAQTTHTYTTRTAVTWMCLCAYTFIMSTCIDCKSHSWHAC